jgi:hypothetical protein
VAVGQSDQLLPKPARRFRPTKFVPYVEGLVRAGHAVQVVYEACGFGFTLYRQLRRVGGALLRDRAAQARRAINRKSTKI